jgi:hypothetical protein
MAKPQSGSKAIVRATKNTSLVLCEDYEAKVLTIIEYLTKFAVIDRRELTDELRDIYVKTICGRRPELSLRQVEKGLASYLESGDRWPWPSALVEMMEDEV